MQILDMLGKPCPIPVIEAKRAISKAAPGDSIQVLVDNDISRQNLEKMAKGRGHDFSFENQTDGNIMASIKVLETAEQRDDGAGLTVVISRDYMGGADRELGKTLMKSFIYSLTELETAPEHIVFFNGGVFLTTEGSNVLEDLEALAQKGTQIATCGLCLNFYKRTEKLAIGQITNMYAATLAMAQAKKLIQL